MQKADFAEHSTGQVTSQRSVAYALSLVVNHLAGYYFCFETTTSEVQTATNVLRRLLADKYASH